jgi:hypothetical protein
MTEYKAVKGHAERLINHTLMSFCPPVGRVGEVWQ